MIELTRSVGDGRSETPKVILVITSRRVLVSALAISCAWTVAAQAVITPAVPPAVSAGGVVQFRADRRVTWSCPRCAGFIEATGLYTAPAIIKAKQQALGCQILPNNHIFNVRVDDLPLHPKSDEWIALAYRGVLNFNITPKVNFADSTTPVQDMVFAYTPGNNGPFSIPPYPYSEIEGGWFVPPFSGIDRHLIVIEKDPCNFQEMYNLYPAGTNTYNSCPLCTSQSGVKYSADSYDLAMRGGVDAASMYLMPLTLRTSEVDLALANQGSIQHALRFTLPNSTLAPQHVWPAQAHAEIPTGPIPYGTRFRLKASFDDSNITRPETKLLVKQLREYGLIVADGSPYPWELAYEGVPSAELKAAFAEIQTLVRPKDFEVVDQSQLMASGQTSGDTEVDAETVVAMTDDGRSTSRRVVLKGVTLGVSQASLFIQAGAQSKQLQAWVHGATDTSVTWSMTSAVGTLSPTGLYTPPDTLSEKTQLVIQATSNADPSVFARIAVSVYPTGILRFSAHADYVDSDGNTWYGMPTYVGRFYDNGGKWPTLRDLPLYENMWYHAGDQAFDLTLAPGSYKITAHFAEAEVDGPDSKVMALETQGEVYYPYLDVWSLSGGNRKPYDAQLPAVVGSDGRLYFVVRALKDQQNHTNISSFSIESDGGNPRLAITPSSSSIHVTQNQSFRALGWYTSKQVRWSIDPPIGSIDADGTYHAPDTLVPVNTTVTVKATSLADSALFATATVKILSGISAIRINCGGSALVDDQGHTWSADYGYSTSYIYGEANPIAGAPSKLQPLYQKYRYVYNGGGNIRYRFPVPNATYTVTLKWAEFHSDTSDITTPRMDVNINGVTVIKNLDLVEKAGRFTAYDRSFDTVVTNKQITLEFVSLRSRYIAAAINGIEIVCKSDCTADQ